MSSTTNDCSDEVTLQSKVIDGPSLINIEDEGDTKIPANAAKMFEEHNFDTDEVTNHTIDCHIDKLEDTTQLNGECSQECPTISDLKTPSDVDRSEKKDEWQSETEIGYLEAKQIINSENYSSPSIANVTGVHHFSESCSFAQNSEKITTSDQKVSDKCDIVEESQTRETELKQNKSLSVTQEENKTVQPENFGHNYQENSQNKHDFTSHTDIFINSNASTHETEDRENVTSVMEQNQEYSSEQRIINDMGADDNMKNDEHKTFDMTSQYESSVMVESQDKMTEHFLKLGNDKEEQEIVRRKTDLIEANENTDEVA